MRLVAFGLYAAVCGSAEAQASNPASPRPTVMDRTTSSTPSAYSSTSDIRPANEGGMSRGSLRAVLVPHDDVKVSSRSAGVIEKYNVEEGDRVKKGQVILELNSGMQKADLSQADGMMEGTQAELDKGQKDFERNETMWKEKLISDKAFDDSKYQLALANARIKQAKANLEAARIKLDDRKVIAPMDGIFFKKYKSVGEAVDLHETVARVVDDTRLDMTVYCGAAAYPTFRNQKDVTIELLDGSAKGKRVPAKVVHFDSIIDPATGTFRIKLEVEPSKDVVAGLAATLVPPAAPTAKAPTDSKVETPTDTKSANVATPVVKDAAKE